MNLKDTKTEVLPRMQSNRPPDQLTGFDRIKLKALGALKWAVVAHLPPR